MRVSTARLGLYSFFLPKGSISPPFALVDPILVEFFYYVRPSIATAPTDFQKANSRATLPIVDSATRYAQSLREFPFVQQTIVWAVDRVLAVIWCLHARLCA